MIDTIFSILKFCSLILAISFINGIRYFYLRRKLMFIYEKHAKEITAATRCDKIKLSAFVMEPLDTGNDMLDLLLFKIHRSVMWCILLLFLYIVSVLFFVVSIVVIKKINSTG